MTRYPISAIPPALMVGITQAARDRFGLPQEPRATRAWLIAKPYSRVLRIELRQDSWMTIVFAKIPSLRVKNPEKPAALYRREYDVLKQLLATQASNAQFGCVVPLLFEPTTPAIVTIEARGTELTRIYSRAARRLPLRTSRMAARRYVELCGRWLRSFHEQTAVGYASFNIEELLDYCQHRLHSSDNAAAKHPATAALRRALAAATAFAASPGLSHVRHSTRHNDFSSHNIIAGEDDGVRVLDFTMADHGPNVFDTCSFWFELEMLKCDPSYSASFLLELQDNFLGAYGLASPSDREFQLARLRYTGVRVSRLLSMSYRARWLSPSALISLSRMTEWLEMFSGMRPGTNQPRGAL